MRLFIRKVDFRIQEEVSEILDLLSKGTHPVKMTWSDSEFIAVEKISYFKSSDIKDFKFHGRVEGLLSNETSLKLQVAFSRIGHINLSILFVLSLHCFIASLFALSSGSYMVFAVLCSSLILVVGYVYFWFKYKSYLAAIILLERLNIPLEKVKHSDESR